MQAMTKKLSSATVQNAVDKIQLREKAGHPPCIDLNVSQLEVGSIALPNLTLRSDFKYYIPEKEATVLFRCSPLVSGRLYPNPATPDLYILDFVDNCGTRMLEPTGFIPYDAGDFGFEDRTRIPRAGGPDIDFFLLNPGRVVDILDQNSGLVMKVSFRYTSSTTSVPVVESPK